MGVKFESNVKECERKLLNAKMKSLIEIGLTITAEAKVLCPVDTGNLRNSIHPVTDTDKTQIGTSVDYSGNVELGTSKQRSQPYLYPAGVGSSNKIIRIVKKYYGGI
jgi:hypothetical protein